MTDMVRLREELTGVLGQAGLLHGDAIGPAYYDDISHERTGRPWLVLRPASTAEVASCLEICHRHEQPLVPQGGMTGLVSAGTPVDGEVALSMQRMARIEELDPLSATLTVQAGVTLQQVQEAADSAGFFFPVDIGARGSCTVGGNLSTNAGGNRVLRYGMMRDLTLGLEAVLADGTVINGIHKMTKNNAGFDLKHLFIGSEGTLGVITRAVLRLHPKPLSQSVAFCSLADFPTALRFLHFMRGSLGGRLTAFEALWSNAYQLVIETVPRVRPPLPVGCPLYVLIESMGADQQADGAAFQQVLARAHEEGLIEDAAIGISNREMLALWEVRDAVSEAVLKLDPFLSYDVSMPADRMEAFARTVTGRIASDWPLARTGVFGHIGDGNLHIVTNVGADGTPRQEVDALVYEATRAAKGSISAEHGIGFQKLAWLGHTRSNEEMALMRLLKRSLDPKNLLSPGRVLSEAPRAHV